MKNISATLMAPVLLSSILLSTSFAASYDDALEAYNKGKTQEAIKLALELKSPEGYTLAARSLSTEVNFKKTSPEESKNKLEQAEAYLQKALQLNANHAPAYYQLSGIKGTRVLQGNLLDQIGGAKEVRALLEKTLQLDPNHAQAHSMLAIWHASAVSMGLIASATLGASEQEVLPHAQKSVELSPKSISMHMNYASVLFMLAEKNKRLKGKYQDMGRAELQKVTRLAPESVYEQEIQNNASKILNSLK